MTWARAWILTLERKFPDALQVLERFRGETMFTTTTAPSPKAFLKGMIYLLQGDKAKAQAELEHARVDLGKIAPRSSRRLLPDTRSTASSLPRWVKKRKPSPKASVPLSCYLNPRTPWMGRKEPLRSPRFMPGLENPMKHFACSIICSRSRATSPFQCSSSIRPGTRCARTRASKL